jgi:hypothetical protein
MDSSQLSKKGMDKKIVEDFDKRKNAVVFCLTTLVKVQAPLPT